MNQVTIRLAEDKDVINIILFIKNNWLENHIFVRDKSFFLHEFQNSKNKINFAIAENDSHQILGILGFLQYSQLENESDIMLVMWKVLNGAENGTGLKLFLFLRDSFGFRSISSIGINIATKPVYEYLGLNTGVLDHYYMMNEGVLKPKIAVNPKYGNAFFDNIDTMMNELTNSDEIVSTFNTVATCKENPFMSLEYFTKRFMKHPYFRYQFYVIKDAIGITKSLVVFRRVEIFDTIIYRVIKIFGDYQIIQFINKNLQTFLKVNNAEYIDIYQAGIFHEILEKGGFVLKKKEHNTIIPDYFEPFEKKNVEVNYFTSFLSNFVFMKGDCDQDRPN